MKEKSSMYNGSQTFLKQKNRPTWNSQGEEEQINNVSKIIGNISEIIWRVNNIPWIHKIPFILGIIGNQITWNACTIESQEIFIK
jgi:hypothetical protein